MYGLSLFIYVFKDELHDSSKLIKPNSSNSIVSQFEFKSDLFFLFNSEIINWFSCFKNRNTDLFLISEDRQITIETLAILTTLFKLAKMA